MICTKCGARLMDTDQFCPKCGAKVIKDNRCPDCGAVLRDGTKFCHKCGRPVDIYRKEEVWEDEEDDDDWDDEEKGADIITIMTAVVGCILLVVVAVLGYHLYRQYVSNDYEDEEQQAEYDEQGEQVLPGQAMEDEWEAEVGEPGATYTLTIIHNVNVRDNPSTSGTNILKVAQEGETYTCYGSVEGGEWYEIQLEDGGIGYIFHEYATVE